MKHNTNIKVGFVCATHQSVKHRPNGFDLFNNYIQSLYTNCEYPFKLFAFDNASDDIFKIEKCPDNLSIIRIKDQYIGGITYTWNEGVKQAMLEDYNVIIVINDDVILDKTINNFIDAIATHELRDNAIYGPISNNANCPPQEGNKPHGNIFEVDVINGFCLGMTRETILSNYYDINNNLFSTAHEEKWGHQEVELQQRILHSVVVGTCYVHHIKQGGWRDIRKADNKGLLNYE